MTFLLTHSTHIKTQITQWTVLEIHIQFDDWEGSKDSKQGTIDEHVLAGQYKQKLALGIPFFHLLKM